MPHKSICSHPYISIDAVPIYPLDYVHVPDKSFSDTLKPILFLPSPVFFHALPRYSFHLFNNLEFILQV